MWPIHDSPLGRIAVPAAVPPGYAVFCTSADYPGAIVAGELTGFIAGHFGIDAALTTCTQVHGTAIARGTRGDERWRECDSCDALWSDERGVALAIKIADCLPVTLIDPRNGVVANVHSGWRGAVAGITRLTINKLTNSGRFDPASATAYLGPSIRVCCFEVGEEVAGQFAQPVGERFVDRSRAKPHVDLVAFTKAILAEEGVLSVDDSGLCTRCEGSIFHSFRKQGPGGGRNLAVVAQ